MKMRMVFVILALAVLSLSVTLAQTKAECTSKTAADSKACCKDGLKASKISTSATEASIVTVSDKKTAVNSAKERTMKLTKGSTDNCTDAEKAKCNMTKASMSKASLKMDCCKDKAKTTKAEKKTQKSEAKGTN